MPRPSIGARKTKEKFWSSHTTILCHDWPSYSPVQHDPSACPCTFCLWAFNWTSVWLNPDGLLSRAHPLWGLYHSLLCSCSPCSSITIFIGRIVMCCSDNDLLGWSTDRQVRANHTLLSKYIQNQYKLCSLADLEILNGAQALLTSLY